MKVAVSPASAQRPPAAREASPDWSQSHRDVFDPDYSLEDHFGRSGKKGGGGGEAPKAGYGRFIAEAFAEEIEQLPRRRRAAFEEAKCQLYKEYDRLVARRWGGAASNSA